MATNRIISGTAATYLNTGVSMISNLILVPMYLHYLGKEQYGLWIVVLSIVSYLGFTKLGIAQSISNFVAAANAKKDYRGIRTIVSTSFWLYAFISLPAILIIIGAVSLFPFQNIIKVSDSMKEIIAPVLLISAIFFMLQLPLTVFRLTLRSLNMIYKEQLFSILFTLAQFAGILIVLRAGIGITGLAIVYGTVGIVSGLILLPCIKKTVPEINISLKHADKELARKLLNPGFYFLMLSLSSVMIWGADNIIIGAVLGAAAVAPYAVAFKFFMLSTGVVAAITSNMLPTITSKYTTSNKQHLSQIYTSSLKLCAGIGVLALILLINTGPDLMIEWVGQDNYIGDHTFYLFICLIVIQTFLFPADAILTGTGQHKGYAIMAIVEGFLNIILSIWWINIWGLFGVAAATLVSRLTTNTWFMLCRAVKTTGIKTEELASSVLKPVIVPALSTITAGFLINLFPLSGWTKVLINISFLTMVFTSLYYFHSLSKDNRVEISRLIRSIYETAR